MGAKAAANAQTTTISGASGEVNYHNVVKKTYATVGQDDIAFYLLMQAYSCESGRNHTVQAQEILALARQELARRHEATQLSPAIAVGSTMLTPTEKRVLKNSSPEVKEQVKSTIEAPKTAPAPKMKADKQRTTKKTKVKAKPEASPSPTP